MTDKTFEKYKAVIDEWFVNGFNGVKAYQKIYPKSKDKSAEANFRKILAIARIEEFVKEKREAIAEANKITIDECVSLLTSMARFDIADCYDEDGVLKPIHEIPKETRLAIEALDSDEIFIDSMVVGRTKKLKTSNRRSNVVELLKVLGGYEKDNNQKKQDNIVVFRIPDNGRG
ncbi:terminase small subunit [Christiangramia forsetii]|uniref:Phage small terminase n=2 Tax=Christiangramia forsetii TaxID=411153 RepID=A0M462_CHRFK|nr:terminase small subunit [Christiangramia forsetii]GGG24146.1 hypothetical protein GCM10011532_04230 [Christiangramia forsetii]CAL67407.1 phage small terminase [Christiangramia forsetii KT0803]